MKYLQTYENYLILEIGEIKLPPYEIDNQLDIPILGVHAKNYFFSTDSDLRYSINIMEEIPPIFISEEDIEENNFIEENPVEFYKKTIAISFFIFDGEDEEAYYTYDDTVITNRGELFRIMSTLKDVILQYLDENPHVKYIFAGGQRGEKVIDKEQRDRIYLTYFKKNKPEWDSSYIHCQIKDEKYPIIKIK